MTKINNLIIIVSFFCLWIDSFFSEKIQILVGFSLIFSLGILHGSNDLLLIQRLNKQKNNLSYYRILSYYILVVCAGILCFYTIPFTSLLLFILFSAYHFGEQQWKKIENQVPKSLEVALQFTYGICLLLLLFIFHTAEVQNIIQEISSLLIPPFYFTLSLEIFGILLFCLFVYIYVQFVELRNQLLIELFYLIVFAIIFFSSSLIWGFSIYFVLWHSIPSIINQIEFLHSEFSFATFKSYIKSGFVFWMASIVGIVVLYSLFKDEKIFNALFFSFLASITFPHVLVIINMFKKKR
jgi:Brp/Blh family beta-carotene 15,15'-monooxygenase